MSNSSLSDFHQAITALHGEIREEGSEFDFRYSLVDHLFTDALGWSRTEGEGHINFEDERKDVLCYDDSDPPFPVIVCETKRPSHELDLDDTEQLETYLNGVGSAKYGILTNGHTFQLYDYDPSERAVSVVDGFDIGDVATTELDELEPERRNALAELDKLRRDRYVEFGDAETFRETYQEVPVQYQPGTDDEGYELFLDAVKQSLDEVTEVLKGFFDDYRDRPEGSYPKNFLETTFPDWKEWREYTGTSGNAKEAFCRETAYIVLNRALFARIAEDKEIVSHTHLSSHGMADELERDDPHPYLDALMDTYDRIDDHYPDLYELGIFDWWWVGQDKRGQFDRDEARRQRNLEDNFNYALSTVLKRLNRFDFEYVNRDILGHVYEDYLPKRERKELGEYYTPLEVVQFMLDSAEYRPDEGIGRKQVLDPACGSGTFLTEVTERLIQHFLRKFGKTSVHQLDADEARTILERVEDNVYGIDINPFAVHITQINLLFRTIDLYDKVTEKNPHYAMEGFEVHVADTLSPTARERQQGSTDAEGEQMNLQQFEAYNGRARAFLEDRNAVDRIKDEEHFDLVVANPPYVRIQNLSGMKDTYAARYTSAIKNFDIYVPFIERGLEWLADDGKLAYICPNRLLTNDYAETIRNRLVEEPISYLLDFTDTEVFDAATPYPCIIGVDRAETIDGHEIRCARFADEKDGVLDEIQHLETWETAEQTPEYDLFTYPQSRLEVDNQDESLSSWKPMPQAEADVFDEITDFDTRITDVTENVFQGLATSANYVYIGEIVENIDDELVRFRASGHDEGEVIERSILKKVLKGREIDRWHVKWDRLWLIFPYETSGDDASLLGQDELRSNYPNAWKFFKNHEYELKGRESGRMRDRDDWYGYIYPKNLSKFDSGKLMTNILSSYNRFVADPDGEFYFVGGGNAGAYGMEPRTEIISEEEFIYYVALLNSRALEFYHKHIAPIFGGKYYSYNKRYLEPHPIVLPENAPEERIRQAAESIQQTHEEITELEYRTADVRNYLSGDHDSTVLDLAQSIDLSDDDYRQGPIRTNDEAEASYQVVMKRGHTIGFEDESIRDFVYEFLTAQDKQLGRSDILNMETPMMDGVLALMDEYDTDKRRIEKLEEEAEEKQAELDDVILREVYGMDDEEERVINEFLSTW
jgi:type I restriction-modification system DNA methylase subunit